MVGGRVMEISNIPLSMIFLLDFGNVSAVCVGFFVLFCFFLSFYSIISQLEIHFIIDFRLKEYEVYIVI